MQKEYYVGIYLRLSKDDERIGESVSIENQKLLLTKYVKEQGWHQKKIYIDDGFSGTNFERPGFKEMLEDAKGGIINLILVKDLSRFGRNYIQTGQFTDYIFPSIGCRFIALNDGIDTLYTENDIMPFKNLFNEFVSRDTSRKIKCVRKICAENGMFIGNFAPYGYQKSMQDKHKLVIDKEAEKIVKLIFSLRLRGLGYRKIAEILNKDKVLPPRDYYYTNHPNAKDTFYRNHMWNDVTIKKILQNEVYIGNMVQNKKGTISYKNRKIVDKPKEEWIRVENTHSPIIDRKTWEEVQKIDLRKNRIRSTNTGEITLFGGLLCCKDCGFKMKYNQEKHIRKNGETAKYICYLCGNYSRSGREVCSIHTIYENPLKKLLTEELKQQICSLSWDKQGLIDKISKEKKKEFYLATKEIGRELKHLKNRQLELDKILQMLYEDKALGKIAEDIYFKLMKINEEERRKNDKERREKEQKQKQKTREQMQIDEDKWIEIIKKYSDSLELTHYLLAELVDYIEIGESEQIDKQKYQDIYIYYKF